jgi:hypothetical protein
MRIFATNAALTASVMGFEESPEVVLVQAIHGLLRTWAAVPAVMG